VANVENFALAGSGVLRQFLGSVGLKGGRTASIQINTMGGENIDVDPQIESHGIDRERRNIS